MTRKLTDPETGEEVEVPTEEELQTQQKKVDEAEKQALDLKESLGIKGDGNIIEEINKLKDSGDPNWSKAREKIRLLETALDEKGMKIDKDGKVVPKEPDQPSREDTEKIAEGAANKALINQRINHVLGKYTKEQKEMVKGFIDKLKTGNESLSEIDGVIESARSAAFPNSTDPLRDVLNHPGGQPPDRDNVPGKGEITETTKEIGRDLNVSEEDLKKGGDVSDSLINK